MASRIHIVVAAALLLGSSQGLAFCLKDLEKLSSNDATVVRDTSQPVDVSIKRSMPPKSVAEKSNFEVPRQTRVPTETVLERRTVRQNPEIPTQVETTSRLRNRNISSPRITDSGPEMRTIVVTQPPELKPENTTTVVRRTPPQNDSFEKESPSFSGSLARRPSPSTTRRRNVSQSPLTLNPIGSVGRTATRLSPKPSTEAPEGVKSVGTIATKVVGQVDETAVVSKPPSSDARADISGPRTRFRPATPVIRNSQVTLSPKRDSSNSTEAFRAPENTPVISSRRRLNLRRSNEGSDPPPRLEDFVASRNRTRFNPIVDSTVSRTNATNQFAASAKKIISAALQSSNSGNKSASEPSVKAPDQKVLPASVNKAPTERKTSGQRFADVSKPTPTTQLKIELGGRPADTSSNVASKGAGHETKVDRRKLAASRLSSFLLGLGAFFGSGEASGDDENSSGGHTVSSHSAPKAVAKNSRPRRRQSVVTRQQNSPTGTQKRASKNRLSNTQRLAQTTVPQPISVPKLPSLKPIQIPTRTIQTPVRVQGGGVAQKPTFIRKKPQLSAPSKLSLAGYDPTSGAPSNASSDDGGTPVAAGSGSAKKGLGGGFFDSVGTPAEPEVLPRRPYQVSRQPATKLALLKKQPKKQPGRTSNTFTGFKPANTVAADASVSSASTPRPEAEAFLKRFKNLAKVEELVKLGNVLFDGNTMKVPFHVNGLGGTFVVRMERGQMKISLESFYTGSRGQLVKEMRETFKHMKSNGTQLPRGLFRIVGSDRVFRFPSSAGVQILQGFLKFIEQTRLDRQSDHQVLFGSL